MCKRQFDGLLDLLNLLIKTANIGICFLKIRASHKMAIFFKYKTTCLRRLFQLHDRDHRICVVSENANNRVCFMIEKHRRAGFKLLFIDERHDVYVMLAAHIL